MKKLTDEQHFTLRRNVTLLKAFTFFWLCLVIIPVIVPLFQSRGLSLAEVYYLQAIFALAVVILEVPSGYFADLMGRKPALVIGSLFHGLGFTWLCFAEGFIDLVLFEVTVAVGISLFSGADIAMLYDTQDALADSPEEKTRGLTSLRFIKSVAEGIAAVIGGILIAWSFEVVVFANAIFAWLPCLLAIQLVEPPADRMEHQSHTENLKYVLRFMFVNDAMLRLICLNTAVFGLATFYVVWMLQPYWQSLGIPLTAFGLLWASQSFVIAAASKATQPLEARFGARSVLLVMALLPVAGYFGMAAFGGLLGILASYAFFVSRGINQVIMTDALNQRTPAGIRATTNSLVSFLFRGIFIVTGPVVGWTIEVAGMTAALWMLGFVVLAAVGLFLLPLLSEVSSRETAASLDT